MCMDPPIRGEWTSIRSPTDQRVFGGDQRVERLPWLGHVSDTGRDFADPRGCPK
jgi:hypothetical protein